MWAKLVKIIAPCRHQIACMAEIVEQSLVQDSSRMRTLKLSTKPFCIGLLGAMCLTSGVVYALAVSLRVLA